MLLLCTFTEKNMMDIQCVYTWAIYKTWK